MDLEDWVDVPDNDYDIIIYDDMAELEDADVVVKNEPPKITPPDAVDDFIALTSSFPAQFTPLPEFPRHIPLINVSDRLLIACKHSTFSILQHLFLTLSVEAARQSIAVLHDKIPPQAATLRQQLHVAFSVLPDQDPNFRAWSNAFRRVHHKAVNELTTVEATATRKIRGVGVVRVDKSSLVEAHKIAALLNRANDLLKKLDSAHTTMRKSGTSV